MKAQPTGLPMDTWGPGVEHWAAGDQFYAVMVDETANGAIPNFITAHLTEIAEFRDLMDERGNFDVRVHTVLTRPTTLVLCDEHGVAIDADTSTPAIELITVHEFPPGTSAAEAMKLAGYEVK